jgi:hypothetical protein
MEVVAAAIGRPPTPTHLLFEATIKAGRKGSAHWGTVVALPHRTNSKEASELVPANALIGKDDAFGRGGNTLRRKFSKRNRPWATLTVAKKF